MSLVTRALKEAAHILPRQADDGAIDQGGCGHHAELGKDRLHVNPFVSSEVEDTFAQVPRLSLDTNGCLNASHLRSDSQEWHRPYPPAAPSPPMSAIRDGRISAIGVPGDAGESIDCTGLDNPARRDRQARSISASRGWRRRRISNRAAARAVLGGVTAVFEMPNTKPNTDSADAVADKLARAEGRMWCDHAFYVGATIGQCRAARRAGAAARHGGGEDLHGAPRPATCSSRRMASWSACCVRARAAWRSMPRTRRG